LPDQCSGISIFYNVEAWRSTGIDAGQAWFKC